MSRADDQKPRIRVTLDADYGYPSPLLARQPVEHLLTPDLWRDLASWLEALEQGNPSDPGHPALAWVAEARRLRERVQAELGPDFDVVYALDERQRRRAQRS